MSEPPGHTSGQAPAGFSWGDLVAALVEQHGTLTQVAWKLIEHASGDDVASIERALRRLRGRGQANGGVWGQRVLRVFGPPATAESRLRWMGLYHSPFTDLPIALCLDQLRLWDRPPISESRARVWIQLGYATCALRQRRFDEAAQHCVQARVAEVPDDARIELALIEAYLASRSDGDVSALLDAAERALASAGLAAEDAACFRARIADQRAFQINRAGGYAEGLALYDALPAEDVHPFASYRRDAGRAYGLHRTGRTAEALVLAQRAIAHAGDGGYTRLRAMGLLMLAKFGLAVDAIARARAIAVRLGDDELLARVERA
jgi:tetratricopeptide (TPR) repeat protein